jgi:hypothetical protein
MTTTTDTVCAAPVVPAPESAATVEAPMTMPELKSAPTAYDVLKDRRAKLVDGLRANSKRQVQGVIRDAGGNVCFIGLAEELLGD